VNREELEALYEHDEFLFKLYFAGLRRYMDYSTGIAGIKRRISYRSLQEAMYVAPRRGVKTMGLPHESKIRRALSQLEKYGLIKSIPHKIYLIFELLLARRDQSVKNKADGKPTPFLPPLADRVEKLAKPDAAQAHEFMSVEADGKADTPKTAKADTPPLSDKDKEKELLRNSKKKSRLPDNFAVTDHHLEMALKNNWPNPLTEIEAFKDYHASKGSLFVDWDRAFYTWLRNAMRFKGVKHGANEAPKQNSMQRAIDNLLNSPTRAR